MKKSIQKEQLRPDEAILLDSEFVNEKERKIQELVDEDLEKQQKEFTDRLKSIKGENFKDFFDQLDLNQSMCHYNAKKSVGQTVELINFTDQQLKFGLSDEDIK